MTLYFAKRKLNKKMKTIPLPLRLFCTTHDNMTIKHENTYIYIISCYFYIVVVLKYFLIQNKMLYYSNENLMTIMEIT